MTPLDKVEEMIEKEITLAVQGSPCESCLKELAYRLRLIRQAGTDLDNLDLKRDVFESCGPITRAYMQEEGI